jgi:hypothetical protein
MFCVMPNTFAPNGFTRYQGSAGAAISMMQTTRRIAFGNATPIYTGDPVNPVTGAANGYITQGVPGTVRIDGIFLGCKYASTAQKRTTWQNYWPGSDATADVEAYVDDDPQARFVAQANGSGFIITGTLSNWTSSVVGQYAQYGIGTGNANNGRSGASLASVGTTVTFPFIVTDLVTWPPGANGTDPTSANNLVVVGFNNQWMRTNGAGPTGIA